MTLTHKTQKEYQIKQDENNYYLLKNGKIQGSSIAKNGLYQLMYQITKIASCDEDWINEHLQHLKEIGSI